MFGLISKSKSVSENDVIKNAIFDAFIDNCLGIPSVKVGGDDGSISFTVRHFGTYGQIRVEVKRSINKWAISVKAQDPSRVNRKGVEAWSWRRDLQSSAQMSKRSDLT